jgi:hypothetical protein
MCNPEATIAGANFAIGGAQSYLGYRAEAAQADNVNQRSYLQGIFVNQH